MLGSKHRLSRFRDSGTATVHTIPELQVLDSIDSTLPHVDAPLIKVEIKQDVLRKIDTISDIEAEDDKP